MTNKRNIRRQIVSLLGLIVAAEAHSYELSTHAALTWAAVNQSILSGQALLDQFDLTPLLMSADTPFSQTTQPSFIATSKPFGTVFWDVSGSTVNLRKPSATFEGGIINRVTGRSIKLTSLPGWVLQGAIREDDGAGVIFAASGEPTSPPEGDSFGEINRYCNHFFDPYHRSSTQPAGLTDGLPCLRNGFSGSLGQANPDWASGAANAFDSMPTEDASRRNHFSVADLYESLWRATTGTSYPYPALSALPVPQGFTAESVRMGYWATTFRALGHVLHLNEDMAQPQHTRNETHGGSVPGAGHKSQMENFAETAVLTGSGDVPEKFLLDWTSAPLTPVQPGPLVFSGYPVPAFARLSDFWSSGPGEVSHLGYGMADYSNHGFFTPANNIGDTRQPYPDPNPNNYTLSAVIIKNAGGPDEVRGQYLTGVVHDNLMNSDSRVLKRSRYSAFSRIAFYSGEQPPPGYMIDTAIYADEASELIKRSAAYAAGIVNHVFRGQIAIGTPAQGAYAVADQLGGTGFQHVKLTLKNTTADIVSPGGAVVHQDMSHGVLMLVAKFHRNSCYKSDISGEYGFVAAAYGSTNDAVRGCRGDADEIVTSNVDYSSGLLSDVSLAAGAEPREFNFILANPIPFNATDLRFQVVFRGQLGADAGVVAVGTRDIPEPTFFSYINPTDSLVCISGNWYKRNSDGSMPAALVGAGYSFPPQTVPHVAISFRQNASKPYATLDGDFALPFAYPLVSVDDLTPGHFFRIGVIAENGAPWSSSADGFDYSGTQPWGAALNGAIYAPGPEPGTGTVTTSAAPMLTWEGVNTFWFHMVYIWAGSNLCNSQEPRDMVAADGKPFPARIQVAASILDNN